ncbi:MAG: DEAD/DEAH box helicase family protein [Firmicutes bacterium]|nr:DEAD/DEAH box helicase family protein [Bacillota bacterium]
MVAYFLYTALGTQQFRYGFTHDPYLDTALLATRGYDCLFVAELPLPVDLAAPVVAALQAKACTDGIAQSGVIRFTRICSWMNLFRWRGVSSRNCPIEIRHWLQFVGRWLHRQGFRHWQNIGVRLIEPPEATCGQMPNDVMDVVAQLLQGRLLSYDDIQSLVNQKSPSNPYPLRDVLQALSLEGKVSIWPGIVSPLAGYHVCSRCGEKLQLESIDCPLCGRQNCVVCPSCRSLGEMRSCRELYRGLLDGGSQNQSRIDLKPKFDFQLTRAQTNAAAELKSSVRKWLEHYVGMEHDHATRIGPDDPDNPACLVWAVCGAGKTEIAFEALALVLGAGLRVVFAIPRRDVVVELAERAGAAFPEIPITALYGGAPRPEHMGPLVIATTHQLLRFSRCFDLAILDEADAFPYAGSAMLYRAFQRAVKPGGLKVYMTATPEPTMLQATRRGAVQLITVPVRHHGYPMPVPELVIDRHHQVPSQLVHKNAPQTKAGLNLSHDFLVKLRESLYAGNRVFIFVPRIWLVSAVGQVVSTELGTTEGLSSVAILGTHSRDPQRDEKRIIFAERAPAVMVSTSVLERGITIPRADVIILYAHDSLYDARTLIQMAGRSGRVAVYPDGKVYFMAAASTSAMQWAIASLEEINATAQERGLLVANQETGEP